MFPKTYFIWCIILFVMFLLGAHYLSVLIFIIVSGIAIFWNAPEIYYFFVGNNLAEWETARLGIKWGAWDKFRFTFNITPDHDLISRVRFVLDNPELENHKESAKYIPIKYKNAWEIEDKENKERIKKFIEQNP